MTKQPLGKTLLRNVIRHTGAHNKIQEEIEMWKMRDWEVHTSQHKHLSADTSMRGHMHCDRVSDQSKHIGRSREQISEHDDREARYWTRKLYEFEANDPDRWGHSGFKELYPEEFNSDSESSGSKKTGSNKMKKSKSGKEASISKRSKKSSRKKKKKKKKKEEEGKRKKAECWSSDSSSDDSSAVRDRQRRKRTKSRHKNKKTVKKEKDPDSSSVDSDNDKERERRTSSRKKRKQDSDSELDSTKKKRKNWKVAGAESSDGSSED